MDSFLLDNPNLSLAQACLANVSPRMFLSISDQYPDLVCRLHVQIRLMGNFGLNGGIPWITNIDDALCSMLCFVPMMLYALRFVRLYVIFILPVLTSGSTLTHFGQTGALKTLLTILWMADT